jgi:hypothetical protein
MSKMGDAAVMSFGPVREGFGDAERTLAGFPQVSTSEFGLAGATTDQLKQQHSALTITTTPEEAQQVIDSIKQHGGVEALAGGYMLLRPELHDCVSRSPEEDSSVAF